MGVWEPEKLPNRFFPYILRKSPGDRWDEIERRKAMSAQDHKPWAIHWILSAEWTFTSRPLAHNRGQSVYSVTGHPGGLCSVYTTLCTQVKIGDFIQYTESFIYLIPTIKDERSFELRCWVGDRLFIWTCPFLFPLFFYLVGINFCLMKIMKF